MNKKFKRVIGVVFSFMLISLTSIPTYASTDNYILEVEVTSQGIYDMLVEAYGGSSDYSSVMYLDVSAETLETIDSTLIGTDIDLVVQALDLWEDYQNTLSLEVTEVEQDAYDATLDEKRVAYDTYIEENGLDGVENGVDLVLCLSTSSSNTPLWVWWLVDGAVIVCLLFVLYTEQKKYNVLLEVINAANESCETKEEFFEIIKSEVHKLDRTLDEFLAESKKELDTIKSDLDESLIRLEEDDDSLSAIKSELDKSIGSINIDETSDDDFLKDLKASCDDFVKVDKDMLTDEEFIQKVVEEFDLNSDIDDFVKGADTGKELGIDDSEISLDNGIIEIFHEDTDLWAKLNKKMEVVEEKSKEVVFTDEVLDILSALITITVDGEQKKVHISYLRDMLDLALEEVPDFKLNTYFKTRYEELSGKSHELPNTDDLEHMSNHVKTDFKTNNMDVNFEEAVTNYLLFSSLDDGDAKLILDFILIALDKVYMDLCSIYFNSSIDNFEELQAGLAESSKLAAEILESGVSEDVVSVDEYADEAGILPEAVLPEEDIPELEECDIEAEKRKCILTEVFSEDDLPVSSGADVVSQTSKIEGIISEEQEKVKARAKTTSTRKKQRGRRK